MYYHCFVGLLTFSCCFFFFKQKTAYERRISDWSSDVCSSDLLDAVEAGPLCALCRVSEKPRQTLRQVGDMRLFDIGHALPKAPVERFLFARGDRKSVG